MLARSETNRRRQASAAFTLVEILVASAVLAIIMAAFFVGLASGYGVVNNARQDLRATQILTQKTEAVRLCDWQELTNLPATFQDYYFMYGASNSAPNVTYYGTITVNPATCIPSSVLYYSDIKLVTINLVWTNHVGANAIVHSRSMQTLAAFHGLVNYIYGQVVNQ